MKIGPVDVEVTPLKASTYMRVCRSGADPGASSLALLGIALVAPPVPVPDINSADAIAAFGDAILDHFVEAGATFADITAAATEVSRDISNRLGFTKAEVAADADFSLATGDGS